MTTKSTARLTGLGYLLIFVSGFYANFYVLETIVSTHALETTQNIISNKTLFNKGILAFVVMILIDILLAAPLYVLLRDAGRNAALFSSALRMVNGTIFAAALYSLFEIKHLSAVPLKNTAQIATEVQQRFDLFNSMWSLALIFFGVHLLILGGLIIRSKRFPKFIGLLLVLAGIGYLIDCFAMLGYANYQTHQAIFENIVIIPAVLGELSLTVFLLVKGVARRN